MSEKKEKIAGVQIWSLMIGFAILFVLFISGLWFHPAGNQSQVFFRQGEDYMADFLNVMRYSVDRNPYVNEVNGLCEKAYFPISYCLFYGFDKILGFQGGENDITSFVRSGVTLLVMFMMVLLAVQIYDMTDGRKVFKVLMTMVLMSSGVSLFACERGNIIFLAVSGMIFFLVAYESDKWVLRELGYIALALAAALKGWPALLGLLLLYNRQWKEAVRLLIYGLAASFLPFLLLQGGFSNIPLWWRNFHLNTEVYEFERQQKLGYHYFIAYDETLFYFDQLKLRDFWKPWFYLLAVFGMVTNIFQKKKWIRVAVLVSIMLVLPSNCGFYCLLYIFPVILLWLNEKEKTWTDLLYLPLFLLLLCPYQMISVNTGRNLTLLWGNIALLVLFSALLIENIVSVMKYVKGKDWSNLQKKKEKKQEQEHITEIGKGAFSIGN